MFWVTKWLCIPIIILVKSYLPYLKSETKHLLACWYLQLARFFPTVKLEYKPGRANVMAGALSRVPFGDPEVHRVVMNSEQESLIKKIKEQPSGDPEVRKEDIIRWAKKVLRQGHRGYYVVDGISYHEDVIMPSRRRLVVPIQLRDQVLIRGPGIMLD